MADQAFRIKNGLRVQDVLVINEQGSIASADRLPEIPISKIANLQTALDEKSSATALEGVYDVTEYTNVQNQTTFEIAYDVGLVQVLYNGVQLAQSDFTATNGTSVVLDVAVEKADDVITIIRWGAVAESSIIVQAPTANTAVKRTSTGAIRSANGVNSDEVVTKAQLDLKVDIVQGKGLSTEDYTTNEKNKLAGIEAGAEVNTVDSVAGRTGAVVLAKADVGLGNVDNTSDVNKPVSTATQTALNLKANLASPTLTGVPAAPTANAGTNTTQIATTAFVQTAVSGLVDTAPETLDTLNELAAALGDDPNFATTVSNSIGTKLDANTWTSSAAANITSTQVSNWDTVYGWGDHGLAGYAPANTTVTTNTTQTISGAKSFTSDLTLGSGGSYEDLVLKTDTIVSGYNGTFSITPRTVPGSGTASQLTHFKNNISGAGTTRHDVSIDGNVGIDGVVGIGTSSPAAKLSVGSGSLTDPNVPIQISTGGSGTVAYIGVNKNGSYGALFGYENNGGLGTGVSIRSVTSTDPIMFFTNNNSESVRIANTGNVGIGTTTPSEKLDVAGNILASGNVLAPAFHARSRTSPYTSVSETGSGAMSIFGHNALTSYDAVNRVVAPNGSWFGHFMRMYYADGIAFHTTSGAVSAGSILYDNANPELQVAGSAERMRITPEGNLGIGTSSPIAKCVSTEGFTATGIELPSSTNVNSIQIGHNGTNGIVRTWNSTGLSFEAYNPIKFSVAGSERANIDTNGVLNVGGVQLGRVHTDIMRMWRTADIQGYKLSYSDGGGVSYTWDNGTVRVDTSVGGHFWGIGKIRLPAGTYQLVLVYRPSPTQHGWNVYGNSSNSHTLRLLDENYNALLNVDAPQINKDLEYSITYTSQIYRVVSDGTFRIDMGTNPYGSGGYKYFIEAAYLVRLI